MNRCIRYPHVQCERRSPLRFIRKRSRLTRLVAGVLSTVELWFLPAKSFLSLIRLLLCRQCVEYFLFFQGMVFVIHFLSFGTALQALLKTWVSAFDNAVFKSACKLY